MPPRRKGEDDAEALSERRLADRSPTRHGYFTTKLSAQLQFSLPGPRRASQSEIAPSWGAACCAPTGDVLRLGFLVVGPTGYLEHFFDVGAGAASHALCTFQRSARAEPEL